MTAGVKTYKIHAIKSIMIWMVYMARTGFTEVSTAVEMILCTTEHNIF